MAEMGDVAGAGLLAHVPTIMLPRAERLELNEGKEISLVPGLERLRREVFEVLDYDTVVVLDSHWHTTVEFVVAAQPVRAGLFTSDELPRGMCRIPYDWRGHPELAQAMAAQADAHGTWITAIDDPCLPVHYATVNLWSYLGRGLDKRWVSVSTAQTGETEDFLRAGRALGAAIAAVGQPGAADRVRRHVAHVLVAAGTAGARGQRPGPHQDRGGPRRRRRADRLAAGRRPHPGHRDHAGLPEVPAGGQVRAVPDDDRGAGRGGGDRARPGLQRVRELGRHRPDAYLVRPACRGLAMTEYRRILLDGASVQVVRDGDELVAGDGRRVAVAEAVHLPPCEPTKIVAVHLNHSSRVAEFGARLPAAPTYFHKPVSALVGHGGAVVRPAGCQYLNYEGEVAIVIGRACRGITPEQAGDYIAGYTIANDFGLHDFRDTDAGSMLRVKGSDTMAPLGPGLVTGWDFRGKQLRTYVNGAVVQHGTTDEMTWDMHYLVADIARTITLLPGDVLLSGTPANSRPVQPGDVVEVEVDGLGRLKNYIVAGPLGIPADFGAQPTASEEVLSTALGGDWEFRGIRPPARS